MDIIPKSNMPVRDERVEEQRAQYRAVNYKPPLFTAPSNAGEIWRAKTNGYTIVCATNPAGGTRTYVEKDDAYYEMAKLHDEGL